MMGEFSSDLRSLRPAAMTPLLTGDQSAAPDAPETAGKNYAETGPQPFSMLF
jgi:hypothetical protein